MAKMKAKDKRNHEGVSLLFYRSYKNGEGTWECKVQNTDICQMSNRRAITPVAHCILCFNTQE